MTDDGAAQFAARHGLDRLYAADPAGFTRAQAQTEAAGAAMPRPSDKESAPAPIFRPLAAGRPTP